MSSSRLHDAEKRSVFFFAQDEAELYDCTADLVEEHYRTVHEVTLTLLRRSFAEAGIDDPRAVSGTVLDIGSGTGGLALPVLLAFPAVNVVAVDFCPAMHKWFRRNYERTFGREAACEERCTLVCDDFLGEECAPARLRALLPPSERDQGFAAAVSAYTMHHFSYEERWEVYRRIHGLLRPNASFVNGDLFGYRTPEISSMALKASVRWIQEQFRNPSPRFPEARRLDHEVRQHLERLWVRHYKDHNIYEPLDGRPVRPDGRVAQVEVMRRTGFAPVEVPFRSMQVAVVWGRRVAGGFDSHDTKTHT